jgi:probable HAF family extracellular repeat protein
MRRLQTTGIIFLGFLVVLSSIVEYVSAASFQGLGDLPGGSFYSKAYGVSANGSVVVGGATSASGAEAFRWTSGGGMVGLGDLPGGNFMSSAFDVSADGSVVVGHSNSASGYEAFRWTSGGGRHGWPGRPARRKLQQRCSWHIRRWLSRGGP